MIGIVLVTHGRLADEFRSAVEHVMGPQAQMETICIEPNDNIDSRRLEIIAAVKRANSGDGVAILTDMFGGTPSNLAISVINQVKIEVIAGVNLPMLIKLAEVRDRLSLAEAALAAQDAGRRYIRVASVELAGGTT